MPKKTCLACGVEKDTDVLEISPYHVEDYLTDDPILPLMEIDCEGNNNIDWRVVTVCHECFHKLNSDMWISEKCWSNLNPIVLFNDLPKLKELDSV